MSIAVALTMLIAVLAAGGALLLFEATRRHMLCLRLEDGLRQQAEVAA
jgi:hypothetical protein